MANLTLRIFIFYYKRKFASKNLFCIVVIPYNMCSLAGNAKTGKLKISSLYVRSYSNKLIF